MLPARLKRKSDRAEQGRRCGQCAAVLQQRPQERRRDWALRQFCDRSCATAHANTLYVSTHEMLMANSDVGPGCWNWTGYIDPKGYGRVAAIAGEVLAHRIAIREFTGQDPTGLHVLHACDNPRCINPEHLSLGTNADNVADRVHKGRSARQAGPDNPNYRHGRYVQSRRPATTSAERRHLDRIAAIGCLVCDSPSTVHHVTSDGYQRLTRTHERIVPLCPRHHMIQFGPHESVEALGHAGFAATYGIDLLERARELWEGGI